MALFSQITSVLERLENMERQWKSRARAPRPAPAAPAAAAAPAPVTSVASFVQASPKASPASSIKEETDLKTSFETYIHL